MKNTPTLSRRQMLALGASLFPLTSWAAWPERSLRLVVPYAAGGGADNAARVVAQRLSELLGQPVVIDNKPGAGGVIGADTVAKSTPDGYTALYDASAYVVNPALRKLAYDPVKDFIPVSLIVTAPQILVVSPQSPYKSLNELLAAARKSPNKLSFASAGAATASHLAAELMADEAHVDLLHVPYKGSGPGMQDVLAGVCQVIFDGAAKPQIDAEQVRLLGTTSSVRDPRYPDVPTLSEGGLTGYDLTYWVGIFAPKGLPPEIQARLNASVKTALAEPEVQRKLSAMGMTLVGSSPEQMVQEIRTETAKLRQIAAAIPGGVN